ncbi:hypothetical protein ACQP00_12535 [Dactylosporangium sp. CS-047395]|uniref:hypothetical protein n=1 Tax=Dactylosporangium sp. CS-047395 TaxID=3239936 RepID=UPI003D8DC74B
MTPAEWMQIVAAIGALAAAFAAFSAARAGRAAARTAAKQLPELHHQVELNATQAKAAEDQVALTQEMLQQATAALREAARARTDERAPLVVALLETPHWPPLVEPSAEAASPARLYARDAERNTPLHFRTDGILINEGATTARVRLDEQAHFQDPAPARRERLLRPGEVARFTWTAGHTIAEWADARENPDPPNPLGACFLTITVFDNFEHGIFDHIHLAMSGRPIVAVDPSFDEVRLASHESEAAMAVTVFPTRRTYRFDGPRRDPLPWDSTYAAWWREGGATKLRRAPEPA